MKTHRGAAKRFRRTASGRIARSQNNRNHILTKKSTKRKRRLRRTAYASPADSRRLQQMLAGVD
jgi:large subunit ribosomal protein L35